MSLAACIYTGDDEMIVRGVQIINESTADLVLDPVPFPAGTEVYANVRAKAFSDGVLAAHGYARLGDWEPIETGFGPGFAAHVIKQP